MEKTRINPWIGILMIAILIAFDATMSNIANRLQTDQVAELIMRVNSLEVDVAELKRPVE